MILALLMVQPVQAMISVLLFACVIAVVLILGRWLLSYIPGVPQPLIIVAGIIIFVILLLILLQWLGLYTVGGV